MTERKYYDYTHQRCGATNDTALVVVLGSVARAHELVLSSVEWHHTSQMCAHSVDTVSCKLAIALDHKVCWVTLNSGTPTQSPFSFIFR